MINRDPDRSILISKGIAANQGAQVQAWTGHQPTGRTPRPTVIRRDHEVDRTGRPPAEGSGNVEEPDSPLPIVEESWIPDSQDQTIERPMRALRVDATEGRDPTSRISGRGSRSTALHRVRPPASLHTRRPAHSHWTIRPRSNCGRRESALPHGRRSPDTSVPLVTTRDARPARGDRKSNPSRSVPCGGREGGRPSRAGPPRETASAVFSPFLGSRDLPLDGRRKVYCARPESWFPSPAERSEGSTLGNHRLHRCTQIQEVNLCHPRNLWFPSVRRSTRRARGEKPKSPPCGV